MTEQPTIRHELAPDEAARWHECAKIFPVMEGKPRMELMRDIRDRGILEPIVFLDGNILDGRNRYLAARELCMVYPRREFGSDPADGDDPLAFVLSKNLHRRHLKESQRAMVATKVATLGRGGNYTSEHCANLRNAPTQTVAADDLDVSRRLVQTARTVQEDGIPELAEAVTQGDVSVSAAAELAKLPEDEQAEVVEAGPDAIKAKAAELRNAPKTAEVGSCDDPFLAALDEAEKADNPADTSAADIEKYAPQTDVLQPEEADSRPDMPDADTGPPTDDCQTEEPVSEAEVKLRKELRKLTPDAIEDDWIGLKLQVAEQRKKIGDQRFEIQELNARLKEFEDLEGGRALGNAQRQRDTARFRMKEHQANAARLQRRVNFMKKEIKDLKKQIGVREEGDAAPDAA